MEWFNEDEEKQGGEGVSLDSAFAQMDARSLFLVVCEVGGGPIIDALDYVYGMCGEA